MEIIFIYISPILVFNTCFINTDASKGCHADNESNKLLLTEKACTDILNKYRNEVEASMEFQHLIMISMFNFDFVYTKKQTNLFVKVEDRFGKIISRLYSLCK